MIKKLNIINILILGFLPIFLGWNIFNSEMLIGKFIDFNIPENINAAQHLVWLSTSAWSDSVNGGYRNTFISTITLQNFILYGPVYLFNSTLILGKWNLLMPLSLSGISYYIFFNHFIKFYNIKSNYWPSYYSSIQALLLSLLFTYNNFNFNETHYGSSNYVFSSALVPVTIAFFHKACIENKLGFITLISLMLTCITGGVLQNLLILFLFYFILFYFHRFNILYGLKYIFLYLFLSLYWIAPILFGVADTFKNDLARPYLPSVYSLFDVLSNRIYSTLGGRAHYEFAMPAFARLIYWIFSFFFLLMPIYLISTNVKFKNSKFISEIIFIICLLMFSIFMLKGAGPPFGEINNFIYSNFTLSSLFRTTNRFWPIFYLCLAFLYSITCYTRFKIPILIMFIFVICIPWYINQDFGIKALSKSQLNEPHINFYEFSKKPNKFHEIVNENDIFKIITKPMNYSVRFLDASGVPKSQGGDADLLFGGKGFFNTDNPNITSDFILKLEYQMYTNTNFLIENSKLFYGLGIKYFIIRKNIKPEFSPNLYYFNQHVDYAVREDVVKKIYSDNDYDIFQFVNFLPRVFTFVNFEDYLFFTNTSDRYINITYDEFYHNLILLEKIWQKYDINFFKISDSIYRFSADTVGGSFPIFLNTNFSEDWIIIPNPLNLRFNFFTDFLFNDFQNPIYHFRAPMLNNGWIINSDLMCNKIVYCDINSRGSMIFNGFIIFKPQIYLALGGLVSILLLIFLLCMALFRLTQGDIISENKNIKNKNS
jgi:hypothetical protein